MAAKYEEEIFSVFEEDRNKRLLQYFEKYANPAHTAIDCGCGRGNAFPYLSPRFKKVIAVDFSEKLLETARLHAPANVELGRTDLTKKNPGLPKADFAFCCNVAMFPETKKNLAIIKNVQGALKRGCNAVFVLPSLESVISKSWFTAEWFRKEGVAFEEIPRSQWADYKFGTKSFLLGLIDINGVTTKHYLRSEIIHLFDTCGLQVVKTDKLEYDWNTEFESPPAWMQEPYPWDWLVECRKK